MEKNLELLIKKLEAIARKNKDRFAYSIEIQVRGNERPYYRFIASETADSHVFLYGYGPTIDEAALGAMADIKHACKEWSYKEV